jgi:prepilin-type processing-associated H-X9-DG protein
MYCTDYNDRMPWIRTMYALDDDKSKEGKLDDPDSPLVVLGPYTKNKQIFACPLAINGIPSSQKGRWPLSYVFYGHDYEKILYGRDRGLNLARFNGELQQATQAHETQDAVSFTVWVRDAYKRVYEGNKDWLTAPHADGINRLYSDGHVKFRREQSHSGPDF